MKKLGVISASLILVSTFALVPLVHGDPGITATPDQVDFGEVELGSATSAIITIENEWWGDLNLNQIYFQTGSSADFSITLAPPLGTVVPSGASEVVEVSFAPSALGLASAVLVIGWSDGEAGTSYIDFSGTGVGASETPTIEDILSFFDAGVEGSTIQGTGPSDNAKKNHLKVFKLKLLMVKVFLDTGATREACTLLWHAYERSDGQLLPKDFIEGGPNGDDVPELNTMIHQLIIELGCE
jgi:hypothetical protein